MQQWEDGITSPHPEDDIASHDSLVSESSLADSTLEKPSASGEPFINSSLTTHLT